MSIAAVNKVFKPALEACGFRRDLIRTSYEFADFSSGEMPVRTVPLAAFGCKPYDFRTACVAVVEAHCGSPGARSEVLGVRTLGAPYVFVVTEGRVQCWIVRGTEPPEKRDELPLEDVPAFLSRHRDTFSPTRIVAAKNPFAERGRQLDFVDAGLLPALNHEVGKKLHELVDRLMRDAVACHEGVLGKAPSFPELFRLVFRVLTGKILADKGSSLEFDTPRSVLSAVRNYYGAPAFSRPVLGEKGTQQLVFETVRDSIRFHNLTPESVAHVYENTLVTKETRKQYGTHSTPSYIADYIAWRLPIESLPLDTLQVFEPAVGCGALLTSVLRRIRLMLPTDWSAEQQHRYFVEHISGFDVDAFAVETALLSLTLADFPNKDGWRVTEADMWRTDALELGASKATVLLANPPFKNFSPAERASLRTDGREPHTANKTTEMLRRCLACLPQDAILGLVVPREVTSGKKSDSLRKQLLDEWHLMEVCLLPDHMFSHSDAESAILIARKEKSRKHVAFRHVREDDRSRFIEAYGATFETTVPQPYFLGRPKRELAVPMLREVWEHLADTCVPLGSLAEVGQGLTYEGKGLPTGAKTVSEDYFVGAVQGYSRADACLDVLSLRAPTWMSLDREVVFGPRMGAERGVPQVLINYARAGRGRWRLKAAIDRKGMPVTSRFSVCRPGTDVSLALLAGILNGPVTNAFLYAHCDKRDHPGPVVARIPIPKLEQDETVAAIETAVRAFEEAVRPKGPFEPDVPLEHLHLVLARIDALTLELYGLPENLRRSVVNFFSTTDRRPGVPFRYRLSDDLLDRGMALELPAPVARDPWAETVGMWSDDETWGEFMAKIAQIRSAEASGG